MMWRCFLIRQRRALNVIGSMTSKKRQIYKALVAGAYEGLTDEALYRHVLQGVPTAKSKSVVKASVLALSDSAINDPVVLQVIFALAIKHRLMRKNQITAPFGMASHEDGAAGLRAEPPQCHRVNVFHDLDLRKLNG